MPCIMINEALRENRIGTSFSNHLKGVWNYSLWFVSLPPVKTGLKGIYDTQIQRNPYFSATTMTTEPNRMGFCRDADDSSTVSQF